MSTSQRTVQNLDSITRNGSEFTARYKWEEEVETQYALPVYTGNLSPKGTIAKSRTLRKLSKVTRKVSRWEDVEIGEDEARTTIQAAKDRSAILSRSVCNTQKWTVDFK